jgi:hypothetical protein
MAIFYQLALQQDAGTARAMQPLIFARYLRSCLTATIMFYVLRQRRRVALQKNVLDEMDGDK